MAGNRVPGARGPSKSAPTASYAPSTILSASTSVARSASRAA
ncbi:hypothetical protein OG322_21130 [Streptomyces sp. NBC_01260]|nr:MULTISPECIES: hypothetical protein [unclassified Streptomyces]MCX4771815.1 hypothetical protein [Streptomyces sp. NBC_01285]